MSLRHQAIIRSARHSLHPHCAYDAHRPHPSCHWGTKRVLFTRHGTGSLGHRVNGSFGGVRPEFFRFSKKCPKCKTYIWNAKMTKVIVGCLLLDWNHWMSVRAMNFYFYVWCMYMSKYLKMAICGAFLVQFVAYMYVWLLKILWPGSTSSHMSRHLEFIIE